MIFWSKRKNEDFVTRWTKELCKLCVSVFFCLFVKFHYFLLLFSIGIRKKANRNFQKRSNILSNYYTVIMRSLSFPTSSHTHIRVYGFLIYAFQNEICTNCSVWWVHSLDYCEIITNVASSPFMDLILTFIYLFIGLLFQYTCNIPS